MWLSIIALPSLTAGPGHVVAQRSRHSVQSPKVEGSEHVALVRPALRRPQVLAVFEKPAALVADSRPRMWTVRKQMGGFLIRGPVLAIIKLVRLRQMLYTRPRVQESCRGVFHPPVLGLDIFLYFQNLRDNCISSHKVPNTDRFAQLYSVQGGELQMTSKWPGGNTV